MQLQSKKTFPCHRYFNKLAFIFTNIDTHIKRTNGPIMYYIFSFKSIFIFYHNKQSITTRLFLLDNVKNFHYTLYFLQSIHELFRLIELCYYTKPTTRYKTMSDNITNLNEDLTKHNLKNLSFRSIMTETLNALFDKETDKFVDSTQQYKRSTERQHYRSRNYKLKYTFLFSKCSICKLTKMSFYAF